VVPNFLPGRSRPLVDDPRLALLPREPFMLFLGDVTLDKGAWNLAEAYRTLIRPPPLVFIGRCYLPDLARRAGVTVLGLLPHDLGQAALRRCLFAVVPSVVADTFSVTALESAAAGKAVVASAIGGLRDVVLDGVTGLLVAPGDQDALRAALTRLSNDGALRARMGEAASRRATTSFSADVVVPLLEDAYLTAIDTRRRVRSSPR
jgi:glycosyltransferase involved in cell wall biosynthesis